MPLPHLELLHRATRFAAIAHREQVRKGSDKPTVPYFSHPSMVALLVQRYGFEDDVIAAALLHDVVEDTPVTEAEVAKEFGSVITAMVHAVSETKLDDHGVKLPWDVRKKSKLDKLPAASVGAKAIALADKLHNLHSTLADERAGVDVWSRFNAGKAEWLANAARVIEVCGQGDPRLVRLAEDCRAVLAEVSSSR
jgi:(p)ppGpp synthase/HD superfamily hydrolase